MIPLSSVGWDFALEEYKAGIRRSVFYVPEGEKILLGSEV
jgi:hypothetical protein